MGPQEHAFRSGVDVIVGTPGRLLDHFRQPYAKLGGLEYLVLDEADRMLDMGFLPDIRRVLRHIPSKRQTLFFSATMPDPIVKLSQEMLQNPVMINLERKAASGDGHRARHLSRSVASQAGPAALAAEQGGRQGSAGVYPHEASRRSAGEAPRAAQGERAAHSRQPVAVAAHRSARRLQERQVSSARRDRHRGDEASM